ncbi:YjbF family lipoprotein [Rhodanobacter sp. 115]|uniref:YjbF family lipoprotein n=1 Tax=Rhodanobacter sp. FW021-MT20 TaxID=1162282 RepID=UPI001ED91D8E|nr:YjbF family lipoprotein [Rhodanobacter sp. 115]
MASSSGVHKALDSSFRWNDAAAQYEASGIAPSAKGKMLYRGLTSLLLVTVLAGCTAVSSSSVDAVKLVVQQHRDHSPTAAEVAARPYYQMQASTREGHAVLILGNVDGAREDWYGSHGVVVFLKHGQVVQTAGLSQNLDGLHQSPDNPFARGLQHLNGPLDYVRHEDWSPGYRYDVVVQARLVPAGTEQLTILGQTHTVLRVDEHLSAPAAHYRATNRYWVDPVDGFIWKSVQQVAPGMAITLVQLRPYRGKAS